MCDAGIARRSPPRRQLLLAHLTLLHVAPPEFVSVAAEAGYDGVSLHVSQPPPGEEGVRYPMLGARSAMLRETLVRLAHTGIVVHDIQGARLRPETRIADFEPMLEAGERLGARYIMTVSDDPDVQRNGDRIAELALTAARHGIQVVLEFMAYSGVRSLIAANDIIERSDHPAATIMVDSLHWYRSGGSLADIAATPPWRMPYLQLCDAPQAAPAGGFDGLKYEARKQRRFPGEGGLPLVAFLKAFAADLPLSVETPVTEWHDRFDTREIARRSIASTRALLASMGETAVTHSQPGASS
jgi:sugar phosphate isomerase/epimerase